MDLETLTAGRYFRLGLAASDKESAIRLLLDVLLEAGAVPGHASDAVFEAVMTRERRLSTGMECGVAIPHGTTEHVEQEVGALGIFPAGAPFETVDGCVAQIVLLLVTPARARHRHVSNMAVLARQLKRDDVRAQLLAASTPEDVLRALRT